MPTKSQSITMSNYADSPLLYFAKGVHLKMLKHFEIRDGFMTRQLYEYNHKYDGIRLTSEFFVPNFGNLIIGSLSNTEDGEFVTLMLKVSVKEPEGTSYHFLHSIRREATVEGGTLIEVNRLDDKAKFKANSILRDYYKRIGILSGERVA